MQTNSITIVVDQELVDYIERLDFEYLSLKDIIVTYLDLHKTDTDDSAINNAVFTSYQNKYNKAKVEYELAKKQLTDQYIPSCLYDHKYSWSLDYSSNVLTITVECECGIKALEEYLCNSVSHQEEQ